MKTALRAASLVLASVIFAGCVVSIGGDGGGRGRHEVPPPVVVPPTREDAAVFAEIDAARKLSFESGKLELLRNVAGRPELSPAAQVHVVNTALQTLSFESSRLEVVRVLVANPGFSSAARESLFRQLNRFELEASRNEVVQLLQHKPS